MKLARRDRFRIAEQAALQLVRSNELDSDQTRKELLEWSILSVHHVHELMLVQAISHQFEKMDPEKSIDVDALPTLPEWTADVEERELFAQAADRDTAPRTSPRRWHWPLSLAAACVAIVFVWLIASSTLSPSHPSYETVTGEQRSIKLNDGSLMVLNTGSRAKVLFSKSMREIHLLEGEALFTVQRDPKRPFQVATDAGVLRALGTQFNVYRRQGATRVAVIEGAVQVSAGAQHGSSAAAVVRLNAGDEATMAQGRIVKAKIPDIRQAVAWRARQLMFRDSSLMHVAEEFNRYNSTQIRIEGDALRLRSISGVFDADDVEPLIKFLRSDPRLEVERRETEVVVRKAEIRASR